MTRLQPCVISYNGSLSAFTRVSEAFQVDGSGLRCIDSENSVRMCHITGLAYLIPPSCEVEATRCLSYSCHTDNILSRSMVFGYFGTIFYVGLLLTNAIAVLSEERFLAKSELKISAVRAIADLALALSSSFSRIYLITLSPFTLFDYATNSRMVDTNAPSGQCWFRTRKQPKHLRSRIRRERWT